jgi:hypothetical protein
VEEVPFQIYQCMLLLIQKKGFYKYNFLSGNRMTHGAGLTLLHGFCLHKLGQVPLSSAHAKYLSWFRREYVLHACKKNVITPGARTRGDIFFKFVTET